MRATVIVASVAFAGTGTVKARPGVTSTFCSGSSPPSASRNVTVTSPVVVAPATSMVRSPGGSSTEAVSVTGLRTP